MPYQTDRHELFGGGIYRPMATNNPEFPQNSVWEATNMVYERSSEDPEKMGGYTLLGDTVNDVVSGLFDMAEGTRLIATSEDGGVYYRTTGNWTALTDGAAATFSATNNLRWSGQMAYGATSAADILVISNGTDAPQKVVTTTISALGGSPPAAGVYFTPFAGRYWLFSGDTAFYSAADNCEDWSGGGSFQIDRGSGAITGAYVFAGNLLIFKRRKILRLLPGTTLAGTSVRELTRIIGTPSHFTISETSGSTRTGTLFFMSDEGIHEIRPTSATGGFYVDNVAEAVKPILDRRDDSNFATCWANYNPSRGEYWLQYNLNDAHPDEGLIGNVAKGTPRWTQHNMRNKTAGCMYISSGAQIQVMGDSSGRVFQLHSGDNRNGAGYPGRIMLPSYAQGDRSRMKRYGRTFIDAQTKGSYPLLVFSLLGRTGLPTPHGSNNQPSGFGAEGGWGAGLWGVETWGGNTTNGQWFRDTKVNRGSFKRLLIQTTGADQWFKLMGAHLEYDMRRRLLAA